MKRIITAVLITIIMVVVMLDLVNLIGKFGSKRQPGRECPAHFDINQTGGPLAPQNGVQETIPAFETLRGHRFHNEKDR